MFWHAFFESLNGLGIGFMGVSLVRLYSTEGDLAVEDIILCRRC